MWHERTNTGAATMTKVPIAVGTCIFYKKLRSGAGGQFLKFSGHFASKVSYMFLKGLR